MATFTIGQRVRVRRNGHPHPMNGHEARVIGLPGSFPLVPAAYTIDVAGLGEGWATAEHLEPLTDPGAEQFIERIRKIAREPAPALPVSLPVTGKEETK